MVKSFTEFVLRLSIKDHNNIKDPSVRAQYGVLEGVLSVIVNVFIAVVKGFAGFVTGSYALIADAVHSLTDCVSSLVIIFCFRAIDRSPSEKHPFGFGRMESIASLIVAVLLVIAGVELVQSAYTVGLNIEVKWNALFFWAVVGTCIIKEVFAQMSLHMSRKIDSSALEADFWHHRTDTITTVLVLISMYVAANYQIYWIDKAACAGVGIFIIYTGIVIAKTAVTPLLGESPGSEEVLMIAEKARAVEGVLGVHDIIVHHYGEKHMVTLHIEVDGEKKVKDVHEIAEEVEKQIEAELPGVTVVHIDPVVKDHPFYDDAVTIINKFSVDNELVVDYSDLLIAGSHDKFLVSCIITVMPDTPESVRNELKTALEDLIDVKGDEISADILVALDHSGASSTIRAANLEKKFLIN